MQHFWPFSHLAQQWDEADVLQFVCFHNGGSEQVGQVVLLDQSNSNAIFKYIFNTEDILSFQYLSQHFC